MSGMSTVPFTDGTPFAAVTYGMKTVDWEAGLTPAQRGTYLRPKFFDSGNFDLYTQSGNPAGTSGPEDNTFQNIGHLFQSQDMHISNVANMTCVGVKGRSPNSTAGYQK
jgi:hypothetical protein